MRRGLSDTAVVDEGVANAVQVQEAVEGPVALAIEVLLRGRKD
jgi:hypothetical protein